jgi:hypothetical protein
MVEDGGGWTLVGRSIVSGTSSSFGWKNATGSATDDANAYSANVRGMYLGFTETLLGTYTTGKNWGPDSFKRNFTSDDLLTYSTTPRGGMTFTPVRGSITAEGMLYLMGYTNINDGFWTRDCDGGACGPGAQWGLKPNGWDVLYGTPHFHGLQGMIFVR